MIKIGIIDDQKDNLIRYTEMIRENLEKTGMPGKVIPYSNVDVLLKQSNELDAVFLDCKMPKKDGFQLSKEMRKGNQGIIIVLFSDYDGYVWKSFDCRAIYFIRKRFFSEEIEGVLEKIQELYASKKDDRISLRDGTTIYRVHADNVMYFEADDKWVRIIERDQKIRIRNKLSDIEKQLSASNYVKIHRSYIVNMDFISAFAQSGVVMQDGVTLPVSKYRYKEAKQIYMRHLGNLF